MKAKLTKSKTTVKASMPKKMMPHAAKAKAKMAIKSSMKKDYDNDGM